LVPITIFFFIFIHLECIVNPFKNSNQPYQFIFPSHLFNKITNSF
jgi:hypothetical protein